MKKTIKGIIRHKIFWLAAIIFLAFLLRFVRIYQLFSWGMDQEYEAFIARNIMTWKHFPLIGVNASDTGLYLGPAFIYFAAIPFALSGGNPMGWAVSALMIGLISAFAVYLTGKKLFNEKAGLFAALIYAASHLVVFYDRQFWNPTPIPLFSLIIIYLLYEIFQGNNRRLKVLAVVLGIAIQCHLSLLIYIPVIAIVIYLKRHKITRSDYIVSAVLFLTTQVPVIIFDLRHNLTNLKAVIAMISGIGSHMPDGLSMWERIRLFISTAGRFFIPSWFSDWFVESGQCKELISYRRDDYKSGFLVLMVISAYILNRMRKFGVKLNRKHLMEYLTGKFKTGILLGSVTILTLFFLLFYTRQIFEYYFLYLFPVFAIASGWLFEKLWSKNRLLSYLMIGAFLILNITAVLTAYNSYPYYRKIEAIRYAGEYLNGMPFTLEALGECPRFGGYRYLFDYMGVKPTSSYMDSYFAWLYPQDLGTVNTPYTVLLSLIDSRSPPEILSKWSEDKIRILNEKEILTQKMFGNLKVYILKSRVNDKK